MRPLILCVLNTKSPFLRNARPKYGPDDATALHRMVERHLSAPHDFVCLSDCAVPGVETIELRHGWPGWWAKMELFRPDLTPDVATRPVVYMDLDTLLIGAIDDIVTAPHRFTMLRDFKRPRCMSSMMCWSGDQSALYEAFRADPEAAMARYATDPKLGDQAFIEDRLDPAPDFLQDRFGDQIESYKAHIRKRLLKRPRRNTRIVFFHGEPGVRDVNHAWARAALTP